MSFFPPANFFPISTEVQVVTLMIEGLGVAANGFFLFLLLRYVKGWPSGKTLLFAYHLATFIFLCGLFFPMVSIVATQTGYTPQQCIAPSVILQLAGVIQILSIAMMAHVRWRIVACEVSSDPAAAPDPKRYVAGLAAFVSLLVIVMQIHGSVVGSPFMFLWRALLCARVNDVWTVIFYTVFFGTAPYVFFCYRLVVKAIREMTGGSKSDAVKEAVRLIYALTISYYITHIPFYIVFFLNKSTDMVTPTATFQGWKLSQISFSTIAPILSIMMTRKYRQVAHAVLTCNAENIVGGTRLRSTEASTTGSMTNNTRTGSTTMVHVKPTSA